MAAPPKNRTGLYLGIGALGAGAYYFYRAGGNPKAAKEEIRHDVNKARAKAPGGSSAEKTELETKVSIDEAANNLSNKGSDLTSQAQKKIDEMGQVGKDQAAKLRGDAEEQATKFRNEAEEKAAEAKGAVSGWFGGKK